MSRILAIAATAGTLFAAYTYFFTDTFASGVSTTSWHVNGTVSGGADGLVSTTTNGGAVIYKPAIPDGTAEYEVKATLKIAASGGTFTIYTRSTDNGLAGRRRKGRFTRWR